VFSDPTAETPWFGLRAMRSRPPTLVEASGQARFVERSTRHTVAERSSPGDLMAYSFTERKRIRKSFGSRESVLEVPYLLQMQKDAYTSFLQAGIASNKRAHEGLQAAFESAFPIVSHNGFVEMKFLEYNLAKPAFDVRECQTRGLTFASAVRARVQLISCDRDSSTS